jgi:hypothetical protein
VIVIGRGWQRQRCKLCAKDHGLLQFIQQNLNNLHVILSGMTKFLSTGLDMI